MRECLVLEPCMLVNRDTRHTTQVPNSCFCMKSLDLRWLLFFGWTKKPSHCPFSVERQCWKYLQSELGNNFPFCQCLLFSVLNESPLQTAKLTDPPPFQLGKHCALPKSSAWVLGRTDQGPGRREIIVFSLNARCRTQCFCFDLICLGKNRGWHLKGYFMLLTDILFIYLYRFRIAKNE